MSHCEICGYSHRYQFPSGSDANAHQATAIACANSILGDIDVMLAKTDPDAAAFVRQRIDRAVTALGRVVNAWYLPNEKKAKRHAS